MSNDWHVNCSKGIEALRAVNGALVSMLSLLCFFMFSFLCLSLSMFCFFYIVCDYILFTLFVYLLFLVFIAAFFSVSSIVYLFFICSSLNFVLYSMVSAFILSYFISMPSRMISLTSSKHLKKIYIANIIFDHFCPFLLILFHCFF